MGEVEDLLSIVDTAYQAALEPALWSDVLRGLGRVFDAHTGVILPPRTPGAAPSGIKVSQRNADALPVYLSRFEAINPIQDSMGRRARLGYRFKVATDQTYVDKPELVASDFYQQYFKPFDMHAVLMLRMGDDTVNLLRASKQGEFETAELELAAVLQRSLEQATRLASRLQVSRRVEESLLQVVHRAANAILLVDRDGRVLHANPAAEAVLARQDGLRVTHGRLTALDAGSQRSLSALVAQAAGAPVIGPSGGTTAIRRPSGLRPLAASVAPAANAGGDGERFALVSIIDAEAPPRLAERRLQQLYGLTPGEERVVLELAAGLDPPAVAERLDVALGTVRVQLKRAMAKTETSRQSELVSLALRSAGES